MIFIIRKSKLVYLLIFILSILIISQIDIFSIKNIINSHEHDKNVIIIDPGHGGRDPGASGKNETVEKHINLQISKKLKDIFEKNNYKVILTRDSDVLLCNDNDKNKKASDVKNRVKLIENSNPDLVISIHLNTFPQSKYYGSQVFYTKENNENKIIGEKVQKQLKEKVDITNNRIAKQIDTVLLLNKLKMPTVLVECGFLSNEKEEELLKSESHQQKIVDAIFSSIDEYFNNVSN